MKTVQDAEEISQIGFGFMASKALFAGLDLRVFTLLADEPKAVGELCQETGVEEGLMVTLLTALTSIGLLQKRGDLFDNSPGAQAYLVENAPAFFGDYLRFQIDRQMYPFMDQLNDVLRGNLEKVEKKTYEEWMSDPEEAELFSNSQHSGSLGPGKVLSRRVDLTKGEKFLDVGGGSGAFSIMMCKQYPQIKATILDFPNVADVGKRFVDEAGMSDRISFLPGNALTSDWPEGQDGILMSYLFSGIPGDEIPRMVRKAWDNLNPGGWIMIHDFMVEDDRTGPSMAALWALQHMVFTPHAVSLTPSWTVGLVQGVGFQDVQVSDLIGGMTKAVIGRKPA